MGFFIILVLILIWLMVLGVTEIISERNEKKIYISRQYDKQIRQKKRYLKKARKGYYQPIIYQPKRR